MVVKTKRKNSFRYFFILKGRIIMKTTIKHIIKNPIQHIMKCTTIVFLAAAMVLCMVACAATEEPVTTTPATEAPVAAALRPLSVFGHQGAAWHGGRLFHADGEHAGLL